MRISLAAMMLVVKIGAAAGIPLPPPRPLDAAPREIPLPAPRPPEQGPPAPQAVAPPRLPEQGPALPSAAPQVAAQPDALAAACVHVLESGKVLADRVPPVAGPNGCGITIPISMRAVMMPKGPPVVIAPPALLRCDLAERLADWVRDDIAHIESGHGDLTGLVDASAYACRGRNRIPGAQLSEHGHGDAIDILAFRFAGHDIGLKEAAASAFLAEVKTTACARFMTVLGPGSDGYHEDNLHLDLENRHNGSHYCHWEQH